MFCIGVLLVTFLFVQNQAYIPIIGSENCSDSLRGISESGSLPSECPPWFTKDPITGKCNRGPRLDGIIEQDMSLMQTQVMQCYCMTEDESVLSVGFCLQRCLYLRKPYYTLPCDIDQLQNWSCPPQMNRRGYLCSQCKEGYGFPVYSYALECVKCKDYKYSWIKYVAVVYGPLTLFYVIVALFAINFASPTFCGVVMFFQIVGNPVVVQLMVQDSHGEHSQLLDIAITFASLWNLDFFRKYYKFCLHPNASALLVMSLELPVAIYPLVLIGVTFAMVKLHDRNFKPLVVGWKVVHKVLKPIRRNVKTSLVEVFASFIYLSCSRLLLTSMYILMPCTVYTYNPESDRLTKRHFVINAPTVEYFGRQHLPFALLAIVLSTMFFTVPMFLLFLYPFPQCQSIFNRFGCNSIVLHTFMDVFQGGYKDGNNGTRDYRWFSGFILLFPLMMYLSFVLTRSRYFYPVICLWITIYLTLHLIVKPFKCNAHNYIFTGMLLVLLGTWWGLESLNLNEIYAFPFLFSRLSSTLIITVSLSVPVFYLSVLAGVFIKRRVRIFIQY